MLILHGQTKIFEVSDDSILLKKKSEKLIIEGLLSEVKILSYHEPKGFFGVGDIVIYIKGKIVYDNFNKDKAIEYRALFDLLNKNCPFLDMSYLKATAYNENSTEMQKSENSSFSENTTVVHKNEKPSFFKRIDAKKQTETKCTCCRCSNTWYVNDAQIMRSVGNALSGAGNILSGNTLAGAYHVNNSNDIFQCPQCGSKAIKKEKVTFWVDKKGNYVD